MSVGKNSQNEEFKGVKEELNHLLENVNAEKTENEKADKTLLEREVAMKAMTRILINNERSLIHQETEKSL